MKKVLIPGSFDPITLGHYDMIYRSACLFDEVHAVIFDNSEKNKLFTGGQRLYMLKLVCEKINAEFAAERVVYSLSSGFLAQYYLDNNIDALVKGARNATDFDYEYWLSLIQRSFDKKIETVIIPARAEFQHISSTVVRELIKYNRSLTGYVPPEIIPYITQCAENKYN